MSFTAKDVQALREKTGCGMMDCKKALVETDGNMDAAIDFLREGLVLATVIDGVGVVVELNAETDFVSNSDTFRDLTAKIAAVIAKQNPADVDALLACTEDGVTVEEMIREVFLAVRENIKVRRFERYEGVISTYVHAGGKIGVMVKFNADAAVADNDTFKEMAKDVAMQIAAVNPQYLDEASVPAEVIAKEKDIRIAQMKEDPKMANKPDAILGKIVEGKMGKYYSEVCLLNQAFVKDDSLTVKKYVDAKAKEIGSEIAVASFVRFEKGEGIEKRSDNFADEVANMIK